MANTSSVTVQMERILDSYSREVQEATNKAIDSVAKEAASKLRNTSPRKTGDYAKGWKIKKERGKDGLQTVTVHNRTNYQLTHLLENGHVERKKKGTYGRTRPIKHIAPVEEWAVDELPREIEERLN